MSKAREDAQEQFIRSRRGEEYLRSVIQRMPQEGLDYLLLVGVADREAQLQHSAMRARAAMKLRLIAEESQRRRAGGERRT